MKLKKKSLDEEIAELKASMKTKWGEKDSIPTKAESFNLFENTNIFSRLKAMMSPSTTILINMELRSGKHRYFTVNSKKESFDFMGGTYIIDPSLMYDCVDAKKNALDYHQDFSLPIKRQIAVRDVRAAINNLGMVEVENATNPLTLQNFIESKVAEGVMRGQAIDEFLRHMKTMIIFTLIGVYVLLAVYLVKSGALSGVTGAVGM